MQRSAVWKFFVKKSDEEASCKICFKIIKISGNTSNLNKHIKTHTQCQLKDVSAFEGDTTEYLNEASSSPKQGDDENTSDLNVVQFEDSPYTEFNIMTDNDNDSSRFGTKRISLVWQFFEKVSDRALRCNICHHEQRFMGNTANALRHLRARHDVDARPQGQNDPENVKRMKALSERIGSIYNKKTVKTEQNLSATYEDEDNDDGEGIKTINYRKKEIEHDYEPDPYPYIENEPLVDYMGNKAVYDDNDDDDGHHDTLQHSFSINSRQNPANKRKRATLVDNRIIAETEYFREKAAYFRIHKHLAALQAKKVKYELEQLIGH